MSKVLAIFCVIVTTCQCRNVPMSPCPAIFKYYESQKYDIFGVVKLENDLSGEYRIQVNMTVPGITDHNINLIRVTQDKGLLNGEHVEYYIAFPDNYTIPYLTGITFNGKVFCVGPPPKDSLYGVTTLTASNYFKLVTQPVIVSTNETVSRWSLPIKQTVPTSYSTSDKTPSLTLVTSSLFSSSIATTRRPVIQNRVKPTFEECGIAEDFKPLVLHGKPTRSGEYPWLVAMFNLDETDTYKFRCAGNLISEKHVITAAHCVKYGNTQVSKDDLLLVFGKHNIKTWAVRSTIRDVKDIYIHPDFYQPADADIAILILHEPVPFSASVRPICMWQDDDKLENILTSEGTVVGWGKDENNHEYVNEPRQVQMPIVSQEICLRSDDRFIRITSNRTFCAGDESGAGPCSGDSGGGFLIRKEGKWYLRGLISVALLDAVTHSCNTKKFIVFSDVPKYSSWVNSIMVKTR